MRRLYSTIADECRQMESVDRAALALIPIALIVAGLFIAPWTMAGLLTISAIVAVRANRRAVATPAPVPAWTNPPAADFPAVVESGPTLAEATAAAEHWYARAEEYRRATDSLGEMLEDLHTACRIHAANVQTQADLAWTAEVDAYKADKLYRRELDRNEKLRARLADWDSRRAAARIRRMRTLSNRLTAAEKRASIRRWIRKYGGIDAGSHAFVAASGFKDRADAIANGFPRELLPRRGGQAFDVLAMEFANNGHFSCPDDRHETDYLLDLIYADAPDQSYDTGERHEIAGELAALQSEHDAEDISFNPSEFAA